MSTVKKNRIVNQFQVFFELLKTNHFSKITKYPECCHFPIQIAMFLNRPGKNMFCLFGIIISIHTHLQQCSKPILKGFVLADWTANLCSLTNFECKYPPLLHMNRGKIYNVLLGDLWMMSSDLSNEVPIILDLLQYSPLQKCVVP